METRHGRRDRIRDAYELLKALQRTSLETTDPEILAIDCWEAFREAVHEAVAEGPAPCRDEEDA